MTGSNFAQHLRRMHQCDSLTTTDTITTLEAIHGELGALLDKEQNVNRTYRTGRQPQDEISLVELVGANGKMLQALRGLVESEGEYSDTMVGDVIAGLVRHDDVLSGFVASNSDLATPKLKEQSAIFLRQANTLEEIQDAFQAGAQSVTRSSSRLKAPSGSAPGRG